MELPRDFIELLESFNAKGVEYLVAGGYALGYHGAPRFTGDLDLFVRPDEKNGRRILEALQEFGFANLALTPEDFARADRVVQLGVAPVRLDLMTSLTGVSWEEAERGRVEGQLASVPVGFLGRAELVANKRALGRPRDRADLEALGESD